MGRKLTVAVAGLVHDHVWGNAAHFAECRDTELVAVSDPNKPLIDQFVSRYPGVRAFRDYRKMLDATEPDIALVCTTNAGTADIVEACAKRGVHVVSEKPMASKLSEADRMLRAAKRGKIRLMVNWPTFWSPAFAHLVTLVKKGAIGKVFQVRERCAHQGPKEIGCSHYFYDWLYSARLNGAGALMDYCCYGAALCRYLQGKPTAVTGFKGRLIKDYITVDDNAVLLLKYPHAISILEASWTQIGHLPYGVVVNGTEGALATDEKGLLLADAKSPNGRYVKVPALPAWRSNQADYFVRVVRERMPIEGWVNAEVSRDAQEILEAGLISSETGKAVRIPIRAALRK
jgi:predicted dehydrogenase